MIYKKIYFANLHILSPEVSSGEDTSESNYSAIIKTTW